jgi:hypothetical protein
MKNISFLLLFFATLSFTFNLNAQEQCGDIEQFEVGSNMNLIYLMSPGDMQGQRFVPECDTHILAITLSLHRVVQDDPDVVFLNIFQGDGLQSSLIRGSVLVSDSVFVEYNGLVPFGTPLEYQTIIFDEPVFVEGGVTHSFWITRITNGTVDQLWIPFSEGNTYQDGVRMVYNHTLGAITYAVDGSDMAFAIHTIDDLDICVTPGDLNLDGVVDVLDLLLFLLQFGEYIDSQTLTLASADFDEDGVVTTSDMLIFLSYFGSVCEE